MLPAMSFGRFPYKKADLSGVSPQLSLIPLPDQGTYQREPTVPRISPSSLPFGRQPDHNQLQVLCAINFTVEKSTEEVESFKVLK